MNDEDHISSLLRIIESLKKSRKQWINNYSEASKENQQLEEQRDKTSKYLCQLLQEAYLEESSNIDIGLIEYAVDLLKGENNE